MALLAHEPGLSIRTLAIGVGLSHAGTVRLVDRLATEGLIEPRGHATDGRARSLYLAAAGGRASTKVLNARDQIIAEGLSVLGDEQLVILGALSERVLRARLQGLEDAIGFAASATIAPSMRSYANEHSTTRRAFISI